MISVLSALSLMGCKSQKSSEHETDADTTAVTQVQFNADSAFISVEKQCSFGPRVPNSTAHDLCGDYIVSAFKALGLEVTEQKRIKPHGTEKRFTRAISLPLIVLKLQIALLFVRIGKAVLGPMPIPILQNTMNPSWRPTMGLVAWP